ncbi:MAG: hypothetical protein MR487_10370 [Lachnospiraceae bacterium]|nr:hypothetical protein [Lachnospiraceae bacterium]
MGKELYEKILGYSGKSAAKNFEEEKSAAEINTEAPETANSQSTPARTRIFKGGEKTQIWSKSPAKKNPEKIAEKADRPDGETLLAEPHGKEPEKDGWDHMISWLDDLEWKGFDPREEDEADLNLFDTVEIPKRIRNLHMVICLLNEKRNMEFSINTPFCELQKGIFGLASRRIVYTSVVFGDGSICRTPFEKPNEEHLLYLDADRRYVNAGFLLMEADSVLRDRLEEYPEDTGVLFILRESEKGLESGEEQLMRGLFQDRYLPYRIILMENQHQDDWLNEFGKKQETKAFLFEEMDEVLERL